jgi:hypothetical protein
MGEFRQLPGGAVDNTRRAVADAGDRDATPQIDERVSVDVDQYPITRRGRINARGTGQAGGHGSAATSGQFVDRGPGIAVTIRLTCGRRAVPTGTSTAVIAALLDIGVPDSSGVSCN